MKKKSTKKRKKQLLKEVEFELKDGQFLVISYTLLGAGLGTVRVTNQGGVVEVTARTGPDGSRFEFKEGRSHLTACDFWLANPKSDVFIRDIIKSKFWSQFNWSELFAYLKNRELNKAINQETKKLVEEFERKAATRLNRMFKKLKQAR